MQYFPNVSLPVFHTSLLILIISLTLTAVPSLPLLNQMSFELDKKNVPEIWRDYVDDVFRNVTP
jgi:hypothetical protein